MLVKSQVKYIQSLGQKKFRDEEGAFIAEGPKIVKELLTAANIRPLHIYALKEWIGDNRQELSSLADRLIEVKEPELERLSSLTTPNQVVAVFEKPSFTAPDMEHTVSLLLDGIPDPGNLGTIIRIADWFGIPQIICSPDSADVFNSKTVQSTMGSITRVRVLYMELEDVIRKAAIPVYAAALEGRSLYKMEKIDRGMILIGNESKGIRPALLNMEIQRVTIPRIGQAESLNAAVATGIIVTHLVGGA
jgi:TrmH family RNA methyltransferase